MKRITFASTITLITLICFIIIILAGEDCDECFSVPVMAVKFLICGLVIIIGSIYFTIKYLKTERIIFNIESEPIRETDEAVDGVPFVGGGIVESEYNRTINSPYTNTPCVYFHSIKEEYIRSGKSGKWVIVENIALYIPFYIKDQRGKLKIDMVDIDYDFSKYRIPFLQENVSYPKNSEVDCEVILRHQPYIESSKGFLGFLSATKYRRSEFVLRPGVVVFVCGVVSGENGQLVLHENENYPLIISKKSRDQYIEEFYRGGNLVYFSHLLVSLGYTIILFAANYFIRLNTEFFLFLIFIGSSIITGSAIFSLYNRIITLKHRALNALSNIEIDLKRRHDLIPNLVDVVKEYSKYEKEIQQIVAEARAEIIFSKELPKEAKPIIPSLVAVIENYPDLKASENFQSLMRMLVDTEGRIAYSREFYNRSVRKYNTLISQPPFLIVSWPLKMKQMDFISISHGEGIVSQVSI